MKFVKAFHWVMTDVSLFKGLDYDVGTARDHFFSDQLRGLCEAFLQDNAVPSFRLFRRETLAAIRADGRRRLRLRHRGGAGFELEPTFRFFDGLSPDENRLRWDRLVCLHLFTMAFVNTFGYEWQHVTTGDLQNAVGRIRPP